MDRRLLLVELNELNIDVAREYIEAGLALPNFVRLFSQETRDTTSETEYQLLEPWIQWPSVHTGKAFDEQTILNVGAYF